MKQKYIKIVKYFNYLVKKTLLKKQNKTNTNLKISNFNKYIIALISFLFLYLFYLSIPTLYDKAWVQKSLENKLLDDFNINFSMSSDISYNILPSPHFLVKNSKIFRKDLKKPTALSEIKNLKIFISQKKLYDKSKVNITEVIIDNANFSLNKNDIKLLNKLSKKRFSNKKINIRKSNIFFKDELDETIAIIKVPKGVYFYNELKLLNLFNFNGEAFNIPFSFELNNQTEYPYNKEININTKKLKLNIINQSMQESNQIVSGLNTTSFLNSKIYTKYKVEKDLITFLSNNSKIKNSSMDFKGELSIKPFDLKLKTKIKKYRLSKFLKIFNMDSIFIEFIKTKLLFNENISTDISIETVFDDNDVIFNKANINFNATNGKININQTKFINDKIGLVKINDSNLFFEDNKLVLNTDIIINIEDSDKLFSFLHTPKKYRKSIKNIFINLDYDFLKSQIIFNDLSIDGSKFNNEMLGIIDEFDDNQDINLNKSRRLLNKLFSVYDG